jgi:hypothetical protein
MKTPSKTQSMLLFSLSLLALLALVAVPFAVAQEGGMDDGAMQEDMQAKMEQHHQMMMERHQKMVEEMKAEMAGLDALVAEMNAADDHGAKIDAIAAVVDELVSQHKKHMGQRLEMMEAMGGHAMGDMPKGHPAMEGHRGHGGHGGMKCSHGDKPCPHCKSGDCPHKDGKGCAHCKADGKACPHKADGRCPHCEAGGECPHAKAGEACPHCAAGKACPHCTGDCGCPDCKEDCACPHCKAGGECPMKDEPMETEEGAMATEGR